MPDSSRPPRRLALMLAALSALGPFSNETYRPALQAIDHGGELVGDAPQAREPGAIVEKKMTFTRS